MLFILHVVRIYNQQEMDSGSACPDLVVSLVWVLLPLLGRFPLRVSGVLPIASIPDLLALVRFCLSCCRGPVCTPTILLLTPPATFLLPNK